MRTAELPQPASRGTGALPALLIVAATFLAYANSLHVPFFFDDRLAIPENPSLRQLWRLSDVLWPDVGGGVTVSGRPILNLSFALNYAIGGASPFGYHVVNACLHAIAGLLVFGIVRRTLARVASFNDAGRAVARVTPTVTGLIVALLWVLHPMNTQAVTYTVQRAESLMALFYLLTLHAFIRGVDAGPTADRTRPRNAWLGLSVVACTLGVATKEVAATAPLLTLLYDRTFVAGSFAAAWRSRRGYYLALAASWLLLALLVLGNGGNRGGTVGFGTGLAPWAYPLTQFHAIARYLRLAIWPSNLCFEYGTFWVTRPGEVLPYALVVIPLLLATIYALARRPGLGFSGAAFFLILAPTSLAPGTIQMIVEHRMYLPLVTVITLAVLAVERALGARGRWCLAGAAAALAVITVHRNEDYRSRLGLWTDTVAKRPENARAHGGLAEALEDLGRLDEAIAHRTRAATLDPTDARNAFNLGNALAAAGRVDEAIRQFRISLQVDPTDANVHNNLGRALGSRERFDDAIAEYRTATKLKPAAPLYHFNLGSVLTRAHRDAEAVAEFETTIRLDPGHADAQFNLGTALVHLNRLADAIPHYAEALRLRPGDPEFRATLSHAHRELGNDLLDAHRDTEAMAEYQASLAIDPADATAHHNLGITYARLGRQTDAKKEFETALRLRPDYPEARRHLQQMQGMMRP